MNLNIWGIEIDVTCEIDIVFAFDFPLDFGLVCLHVMFGNIR
jgi:hypothetical protein